MAKNKINNISVHGGNAKGGFEYNVIEAPCTQMYTVTNVTSVAIRKDTYWHGYMRADELRKNKIVLDANPRKPGPTRVVRLMQATMQSQPLDFHHLNNGITIIAKEVVFDSKTNKMKLTFSKKIGNYGDGVCNGGHTYFAIEQFQGNINKGLLVRFEIIELDKALKKEKRMEKIKSIADARNAHNQLQASTTTHFLGHYDKFIEELATNSIFFRWFEGDPNAIKNPEKAEQFIAQLCSISPFWFQHYLNPGGPNGSHMTAARNTASQHTNWYKQVDANKDSEQALYSFLPMLDDIFLLRDHMAYSLYKDSFTKVSKVWKKTKIWEYLSNKNKNIVDLKFLKDSFGKPKQGYGFTHTFATMLLGAFRENVWFGLGDSVDLIGWLVDPFKLWEDHRESHFEKLNNIAKTISAPSFGNAFLQNAAIYSYQFSEHEFGVKQWKEAGSPEIIYDISSGDKYRKNKNGTHHLELTIPLEKDMHVLAQLNEGNSEEFTNYSVES